MTLYYTAEATPVITETEAGCGNNARAVHFQGSPFVLRQQSDGRVMPWRHATFDQNLVASDRAC